MTTADSERGNRSQEKYSCFRLVRREAGKVYSQRKKESLFLCTSYLPDIVEKLTITFKAAMAFLFA